MTTGAMIGIGVGVAAAGGIAFVVLRKRTTTTIHTTSTDGTIAGTSGGASASSLPGGGPLDTINSINAKACAAVVGSKVGGAKGTIAAGCAAYEKYLSPIALGVTLPLKAIEALPVIGGPAKSAEHAVSTATIGGLKAAAAAPAAAGRVLSIADLPFKSSNPAVNTVAKVAVAPIYVAEKTLGLAAKGASSAVSAIRGLF
jgi:hypothetical protein